MKITKKSPFTNKLITVDLPITQEQYATYKQGVDAELVFPNLSREHLLFIKYGMSPEEHKKFVNTFTEAGKKTFQEYQQKNGLASPTPRSKADSLYDGIVFPGDHAKSANSSEASAP